MLDVQTTGPEFKSPSAVMYKAGVAIHTYSPALGDRETAGPLGPDGYQLTPRFSERRCHRGMRWRSIQKQLSYSLKHGFTV